MNSAEAFYSQIVNMCGKSEMLKNKFCSEHLHIKKVPSMAINQDF